MERDAPRPSRSSGPLPISVVTVCFNESADKIRYTFPSIASQTHQDFEWIVVDGGSGDETLSAIREHGGRIDCLISEPDQGIYDAMNKGIKRSSGRFVNFMNVGDRFYSTDTLETVAEHIAAEPAFDCYYGDVVARDSDGTELAAPQTRRVTRRALWFAMVCHQSILASRELFDRIGSFDTSYRILADRDWALRSIDAGARWRFMDMFICCYDNNGISANVQMRRTEENRFIAENYKPAESFVCYFLCKYRNLNQRIRKMLGRKYRNMPTV